MTDAERTLPPGGWVILSAPGKRVAHRWRPFGRDGRAIDYGTSACGVEYGFESWFERAPSTARRCKLCEGMAK